MHCSSGHSIKNMFLKYNSACWRKNTEKFNFTMVFVISFFISLLWTFNVAKISVSNLKLKLIYAAGAGRGAVTGLCITNI